MATLILTTVGTILGGPIGAAIGAVAGQAIDAEIFKPAGRQGPRIADLRVQTSTYGAQVPGIFGRMRVAGTVIWATDLIESSSKSGGGKGRPSVTTYNYSCSFAVALSSRPITRIGRIWADGNLLRGEAGDFKAGVGGFRVYTGAPDQMADPLILADCGADVTPAWRDFAYVVFEGLQLADFGNRIPSLTFEMVADEAPVPLSRIAASLRGGAAVGFAGDTPEPELDGYAAVGENAGDAIAPLIAGYALQIRGDAAGLSLTAGVPNAELLAESGDLRSSNGRQLDVREEERQPIDRVPRRLSVRYYDPDRDYQTGIQSAERQSAGREEVQVDLPALMSATAARQAAAQSLRRRFLGRRTVRMERGWRALGHSPGDVVSIGTGGAWRIETLEWESAAVRLTLVAVPSGTHAPMLAADAGQNVRQRDRLIGPTHLALIETPQLTDTLVEVPQVFAAACGGSGAWRPAALFARSEAGGGYEQIGAIRQAAVIGLTVSALPGGSSCLIDMASSVDVVLHDSDAILAPASDAALINGANACMVGDELLQFGRAEEIGPRVYRLSRLLRGRRGTERFMAGHGPDETFIALQSDALFGIDGQQAIAGRLLEVAAQGVGDAALVSVQRTVTGRALTPPSPVHLRVAGSPAAGLDIIWIRRSRLGWAWSSGSDAPLGEEQESYLVEISYGGTVLRSVEVGTTGWFYPPDAISADLAVAGASGLSVHVRQRGTFGLGEPVVRTLDI
jgi:hypothetical protein